MKVRLIADGILPADWLTADMETVPRKGDRVLVYDGRGAEHLLAVESVTWPVSPSALRHHADADMPEVALRLIDDMGDDIRCDECGESVEHRADGVDGPARWYHTATDRAWCYRAPEHTETAPA